MFVDLRQALGVSVSRYLFRKMGNEVISFSSAISASRSVMVILPINAVEIQSTLAVIQLLKSHFPDEAITVVSGLHEVDVMRILPRSHFLHFHEQEINFLFIPHKELLRRVALHAPDLAIDLNLDFVLPSAYICRASGARIRIGFARKHSDPYYNFQVRADPTLARKLIYDRLASCLHRF